MITEQLERDHSGDGDQRQHQGILGQPLAILSPTSPRDCELQPSEDKDHLKEERSAGSHSHVSAPPAACQHSDIGRVECE